MTTLQSTERTRRWRPLLRAVALLGAAMVGSWIPSTARAEIFAYLDQTSYCPGDTARVHMSSSDADVDFWVERGGATDVVYLSGTWTGQYSQATADSAFTYGCGWAPTAQFEIGTDWPPGAYALRLRTTNSVEFEDVPLTLKPPTGAPKLSIVYVRPVSTLLAYNDFGGASYYLPSHAERAHVLSFARPFSDFSGHAEFSSAEKGLLELLDTLPVDYYDSIDVHMDPSLLQGYALLITAMHDEYVSRPLYDAYEEFRDRGDDILFLAANNIYYPFRYDPLTRRQTCYKASWLDPMLSIDPDLVTGHWRYDPLNRPEEGLVGVSYSGWMVTTPEMPGLPALVRSPDHWAFVGTGLQEEDEVGFGDFNDLVMGEWDHTTENSPPNIEILLDRQIPIEMIGGSAEETGLYQATYYEMTDHYGFPSGNGGRVFASGSNYFGSTIGDDPRITTLVENLIEAALTPLSDVIAIDLGSGTPASGFLADQAWTGSGYGHTGGASVVGDPGPEDAETQCPDCFAELLHGATGYAIDVEDGFFAVELGFWQADTVAPGTNVLEVQAEGSPVVESVDLATLVSEGRGQSVRFVVRVEDGTLDLSFVTPTGDPGLAFLHVRKVWPETAGPAAPSSPGLQVAAGGYWLEWTPPADPDVRDYVVEWKQNPVTDPVFLLEEGLTRPRAWIPNAALGGQDTGELLVSARDLSGNVGDRSLSVVLPGGLTGAPAPGVPTTRLALHAAPNPFNPSVSLRVENATASTRFAIYTLTGRLVRSWNLPADGTAEHTLSWDGTDASGLRVSSGVYLARAVSGDEHAEIKIALVK